MELTKLCRVCGAAKSLAEFPPARRYKDGLDTECRVCYRARQRAWKRNNKDKVHLMYKRHLAKHGDAMRAKGRARYAADPEKHKAYHREYRAKYPWKKREREWRQKYGITRADYDAMLLAQGGGCAICAVTPESQAAPATHKNVLYVDHDHRTGAVRGLLCNRCNRVLGLLEDDADLLQKAIGYLAAGKFKLKVAA